MTRGDSQHTKRYIPFVRSLACLPAWATRRDVRAAKLPRGQTGQAGYRSDLQIRIRFIIPHSMDSGRVGLQCNFGITSTRLVNRREPSLIYTAIPLVHGTITDAHLATMIGPLLPLIRPLLSAP